MREARRESHKNAMRSHKLINRIDRQFFLVSRGTPNLKTSYLPPDIPHLFHKTGMKTRQM